MVSSIHFSPTSATFFLSQFATRHFLKKFLRPLFESVSYGSFCERLVWRQLGDKIKFDSLRFMNIIVEYKKAQTLID